MLTIYGRATSVNVQVVMWAVGELGLAHERLDVGGAYGGTDTADYGAMNTGVIAAYSEVLTHSAHWSSAARRRGSRGQKVSSP